jgi:hypothetical protein
MLAAFLSVQFYTDCSLQVGASYPAMRVLLSGGAMVQIETVNFRKFKTYADDRERKKRKALSVIEENGIAAALERCRALTDRINTELGGKKPGHLNIASLAEFQVALERAASVLNEQLGIPRMPGSSPEDRAQSSTS